MRDDRRRALLILIGGTVVVALAVVGAAWSATDGHLGYALDDAYIHLDLTRHLVHDGTFGLVPGRYESASSSPLWEVVLAPFSLVAADATWPPLMANVIAGMWLLWQLSAIPVIQRLAGGGILERASVALIPVALGLVPLTSAGMEHVLHVAIAVSGVLRVADRLGVQARAADLAPFRSGLVGIALLLAVGSLVRLETAFLAAGCALAFLLVRRYRDAAVSLAASAIPLLGFAVINTAFGQYPVPNSVAAKSAIGSGLPIPAPADVLDRLLHDPLLLAVFVVLAVRTIAELRASSATGSRATGATLLIPVVAITAQLVFGDVGWFERYQAWLIATAAVSLVITLPTIRGTAPGRPGVQPLAGRVAIGILLAAVLRVPLHINTPTAIRNIHQSQEQLGRFLAATYPGQGVIVNDIGWVGWLHDGPLVDVYGLGSIDLLRARKEGRLDRDLVAEQAVATGSQVMAVYDEVFGSVVPPGWERGGRWCTTTRRYVLSSECVTFYAPPGAPTDRLRDALARFEPELPDGVRFDPVG